MVRYYLIYRTYSNFASCPNNVLYQDFFSPGPGSNSESHIAFSCQIYLIFFTLKEFLILSLTFMTQTFLKSPVIYRLSFNFCLTCSHDQIRYVFLEGHNRTDVTFFSVHCIKRYVIFMIPLMLTFNHLVWVVRKITLFPFVIKDMGLPWRSSG